uniref:Putative secreted protein n=1 Tax=Ixodes ricinus TaxID=34613 RepID=A0A6B0U4R0_IXORI
MVRHFFLFFFMPQRFWGGCDNSLSGGHFERVGFPGCPYTWFELYPLTYLLFILCNESETRSRHTLFATLESLHCRV